MVETIRVEWDPADVTVAECIAYEEATGLLAQTMFAPMRLARAWAGIAWLHARRTDPAVTYEDVLAKRYAAIDWINPTAAPEDGEAAPEPEQASGDGAADQSAPTSPSSPPRSATRRESSAA